MSSQAPKDPSAPVFKPIDPAIRFPETERGIMEFWRREHVFDKTLQKPATEGEFVFYEGPPTANGTPHNGHVLTRVTKDLFPRYKTMRGYHVGRKAGWDTHGLPVEVEVEKELRIHGKAAIEQFGVEPFVRRCIDSVFRYTEEWERLTERIAFWVDLKDAYVTYHKSYVESVWWALSRLLEKGLLYRGHKVVWWWAQGGTALSSAEVGLGYKTVDDPSCFVRFALRENPWRDQWPDIRQRWGLRDAPISLAVWTTTPWTLPSNMYVAARAGNTPYELVDLGERGYVLVASDLAEKLAAAFKGSRTNCSISGESLAGAEYEPPFATFAGQHHYLRVRNSETKIANFWRVVLADFVTLDSGTGLVHIAPAFGEDDARVLTEERRTNGWAALPLLCHVNPDGTFISGVGERYAGRWVKDTDKDILRELEDRGLLLHRELYRHDYPFCWRAEEDPLIQFARPAWFIRTTAHKDDAIANNRAVDWLPPHIKEGRMGDFLANNVDWALSRERFWGTPLNIWECPDGHMHAPESVAAIEKLNPHAFDHFRAAKAKDPHLNEHLIVHKPWIDQVTFPCPHPVAGPPGGPPRQCGAEMRRVPEVIDCWFDSGCMPFAQWGFPHAAASVETLRKNWPADFISEAIDQTRGWFYSLLMISTLVFDEKTRHEFGLDEKSAAHPYKTCIVLGHVGDKEGKKESKSKGNYTPPEVILDRVRMEFAVVDEKASGVPEKKGECFIAREDLEGLDLSDGAKVRLYRGESEARAIDLVIRAHKKLPRRVVVLHPDDRVAVGASVCPKGLAVRPVEVPREPPTERVYVEDPSTPAPGADAFRWFFYASSPPWTNTRHSLTNVRAYQKDFAIKLRNVLSFFTIYAGIDRFDPRRHRRSATKALQNPLDRWLLSELSIATRDIRAHMDKYESYDAAQTLIALVESLSNWYVRRSRDRFWAHATADESQDKRDAYGTLHEALVTIAKLSAPFVPYLAEEIYQSLMADLFDDAPRSVHLCDYPAPDEAAIDEALSKEMADARAVVSLGLQVRTSSKLKVRQPLATATVVVSGAQVEGLRRNVDVIRDELNVHEVVFALPDHAEEFVAFKLKPNFRALGPRIGKEVQAVKKALEAANAGALRAELVTNGKAVVPGVSLPGSDGKPFEVTPEEIEVVITSKEGFAAAGDRVGVVVLDTRITPELKAEGIARELQNRLQTMRKELGLAYEDRVVVHVAGPAGVIDAARAHEAKIAHEVLCTKLELSIGAAPAGAREVEIEGETVTIAMSKG